MKKPIYKVLTGMDYTVKGKTHRVEPGDTVNDLPAEAIAGLIEIGAIAPEEE